MPEETQVGRTLRLAAALARVQEGPTGAASGTGATLDPRGLQEARGGGRQEPGGADHSWAPLLLLESASSCADAREHLSKVTFLLLCLPAGSPGPTSVPQAPIALTTTPASLKGSRLADGARNCPEFQNLDVQSCAHGWSRQGLPSPERRLSHVVSPHMLEIRTKRIEFIPTGSLHPGLVSSQQIEACVCPARGPLLLPCTHLPPPKLASSSAVRELSGMPLSCPGAGPCSPKHPPLGQESCQSLSLPPCWAPQLPGCKGGKKSSGYEGTLPCPNPTNTQLAALGTDGTQTGEREEGGEKAGPTSWDLLARLSSCGRE